MTTSVAVVRSAVRICSTVRFGRICLSKAISPAICGAAAEVPENTPHPLPAATLPKFSPSSCAVGGTGNMICPVIGAGSARPTMPQISGAARPG
ncbi:hypothetical protein D9M68_999290 [compost metagenome]